MTMEQSYNNLFNINIHDWYHTLRLVDMVDKCAVFRPIHSTDREHSEGTLCIDNTLRQVTGLLRHQYPGKGMLSVTIDKHNSY